jgi:hypothetical protein
MHQQPGGCQNGKTLIFLSGFVQVILKRLHIMISAFSYQTADGSGKPKAVWVLLGKAHT